MVDSPSARYRLPGAATAPPATPTTESRTTVLYRAALGPVRSERYLAVFARFDLGGPWRPTWHTAAALCTLNWLVFRRLWGAALAYGVLLLAVLGLGRWWWPVIRTWPSGLQWWLGASLGLLAVVGPGLAGDALLHHQVQQRVMKAVAASRTMAEARTALARQASTPLRLWGLVGINGLILIGVLLQPDPLVVGWTRLRAALAPMAAEPAPPTVTGAASVSAGGSAQVAGPVLMSLAEPREVESTPSVPAVPEGGTPMPPPGPAPAQAPALRASPPAPPAAGVRAPGVRYGINVGLFADAGNARRAHERLRQAGLPATRETVTTASGPRSRVRVGPFQREDEAKAAAQRIRALGLDAVVFPR
ncbi:SPOR domain-containing protein [Hydrogenophaga sp.]|uniref:SPOR domain-containing protein n=1 Tax=Hydrogenophaga sp. TaxID=1904254 RepID=UPI00286E3D53|nr:SPOR domain-containing protein [Hydrogenophaga sp.]